MTITTTDPAVIADVTRQLCLKFPHVPAEVVESAVQREYAALDPSRHDLAPLLLARAASHELAQLDGFL